MTLIDAIQQWQDEARTIAPPHGTSLLPSRGGLSGPAFFPEGLGLRSRAVISTPIFAIGHNFGCKTYRENIDAVGREDDQPTWQNLDRTLRLAGANPDECFRTNWFIGLLAGATNTGKFLSRPDYTYETACRSLLISQIKVLRPKTILLLGPEVAKRAHTIVPALLPWKSAKSFADFDQSRIGHSVRNAEIPAAEWHANVAVLLHPSFSAPNEARRMKNMVPALTEAEIVRAALAP